MIAIPYLVYSDFVKQVQEVSDLVDYLVIDISEFTDSPGVRNFYENKASLSKALKAINKSREV